MNRGHLYKLLLILFILAWSLYSINPPNKRDLYEVFIEKSRKPDATFTNITTDYKKLYSVNTNRAYGNLRMAVGTNDITKYFDYDVKAEKDPTLAILNRLQKDASGKFKLGLDLIGGSQFVVQMQTDLIASNAAVAAAASTNASSTNKNEGRERFTDVNRDVALDNAVEVLRKRVDKFGVAEPLIQKVSGQGQIVIQMPGLSQDSMASVRKAIETAAFLEFRMVHDESDRLLKEGIVPPGYEVKKEARTSANGEKTLVPFLLSKQRVPNLTGKNVQSAGVVRGNMNDPQISFRLDSDGAKAFADITSKNVGKQLAILLDGELYSAPVIRVPILDGSGVISGGNMSDKDAFELASILENPLEAPVKIISETTVDPSLGQDSIDSGIKASIWGTVLVAGFMAVYYLLSGLVANVALIVNIIVLLGVMCSVGSTLTLPGIAGIVLTVGMAVDANVLIFERIREESAKGKSLRGALEAGYSRAFGTIFDSHVTTLISSTILISMGTGTIKGFGVALTIGVAASLFTALVVTRLIFDALLAWNMIKSFRMFHLIRTTNIQFMSLAKVAFIVTWVFIIISCGYGFFYRGSDALGIDFKGGDNVTLNFVVGKKVDVDKIRATLKEAKMKEPQIQYQKEIVGGKETLRVTTEVGKGNEAAQVLAKAYPDSQFAVASLQMVGPTVGKEIEKSAVVASLLSLFGILVYIALRYEFSFAVGAVVAVFHDIFLVIGAYFLSGREFNVTTVAALLTMMGFSTNDTIVIFDRIREDLKMGVRGSFKDLINQALNQTLSRTIITSGTVFLATVALYLFGGGAINDFAFTFMVGVVTGTYSSIYIASALVLWWHKGERPAIGSNVSVDGSVAAKAEKAI